MAHRIESVDPDRPDSLTRLRELLAATDPAQGIDQDAMERLGWVNIGYKHDVDKARRALSFCDIPGFDGMSMDNAIYWLRNRPEQEPAGRAENSGPSDSALKHSRAEWAALANGALQALRDIQAGVSPADAAAALSRLEPHLAHCREVDACAGIAGASAESR
ncbi:hypothetical protein D3C71_24740 [compost metagenome]